MSEEELADPIELNKSVPEFLALLRDMGRGGDSCILLYEGQEIGAFVPMEAYLSLQQPATPEIQPWENWSDRRRRLQEQATADGGGDGQGGPARQS